ncbi:hypothetical protein EDD76_108182 [Kineothrix alysoides]|uniref:Uncharacterized protein n=1 Tax=Kineothrix alysoides TaxID=1469948 RepID=A0A4R1QVN2_9FIRM|nr:hypothetical protein [Kineothrix alysoides]TCL57647.1 hypothetical protein EDD76_108182 [Kineothrix alysoides]
MSNIRFDKETNVLSIWSELLQKAITDIEKKTGVKDDEIEWIIFDEKDYLKCNFLKKNMPSFIYQNNYKYGFCYVNKKQIWISTSAIMTSSFTDFNRKLSMAPIRQNKKEILLVNVILDELAHIVTKENHGNKEYDSKLERYHKAYYGQNCFEINSLLEV